MAWWNSDDERRIYEDDEMTPHEVRKIVRKELERQQRKERGEPDLPSSPGCGLSFSLLSLVVIAIVLFFVHFV